MVLSGDTNIEKRCDIISLATCRPVMGKPLADKRSFNPSCVTLKVFGISEAEILQ